MSRDLSNLPESSSGEVHWWQSGIIYQIYPLSFQDTNGDGYGDLEGIISRLDYLAGLGIDAIWLSPIFPSPLHDCGYDVADYLDVGAVFGTLDDLDRLLDAAHTRGLRVMLDLVPNHTSDEHAWFQESRSSRDNPKRDWYIWSDPAADGGAPNNWDSYFGGPAWTLDEQTGQYYLHQFDTHQPELNYRHPEVLPAMLAVMRFWLDRGVDGFRVDVLAFLLKDAQLRDEPENPDWDGRSPEHRLLHVHTRDVEGVHEIVREMRSVVDEYPERFMVGEIYLPFVELARYYGEKLDECHFPCNFELIEIAGWSAARVRRSIEDFESTLPQGAWPNWVTGNHDRHRTASRVGRAQARVAMMLLLTLRGTPTVYYGEELGMENGHIPADRARDPLAHNLPQYSQHLSRDQVRTPMQWAPLAHGGFTSEDCLPWLPVGEDYIERNVEVQSRSPRSPLSLFKSLTGLRRKERALSVGAYASVQTPEESEVLSYLRTHESRRILVCLNFWSAAQTLDLSDASLSGEILLSTGLNRLGEVDLRRLIIEGDEGLIIALPEEGA